MLSCPDSHSNYLYTSLYPGQSMSMDPTSVDFRAFYPYTPNEVKHRKRTTPSQLKTLETVFKRDTKPNGTLRVDLAAKLGMTPRGVQVWFQNRRAKEKIKVGKMLRTAPNQTSPESHDDAELPPDSPAEPEQSPPMPPSSDSPSQSSSPVGASPLPQLQADDEPPQTPWEASPIDLHSLYVDPNLHLHRRGSLPANPFPHSEISPNSSPTTDVFDPLARRLSVDASLQRLANNPYAPLARAKNGAVFGPRATVPVRHRPVGRVPYDLHPPMPSASMPYRLDMRRASMGAFRLSPQGTASPSPSPLSPYHGIRASLPDHNLYTVTSRTISSPLPGPLPSPNFSFGAANTASVNSGDSEQNSPDSSQAYRESEQDDEDGTQASYYSLSRFGSITSIATSDSSINSSYYSEVVGYYPDNEHDHNGRRDSCTSGHFASLMSGLDVNGIQESLVHDHNPYTLHEDIDVPGVVRINSNGSCVETSTYPSPTSTISPGPGGSPRVLNGGAPPVHISKSSELTYALHRQSHQSKDATVKQVSPTETELNPSSEQYSYAQDASQPHNTTHTLPAVEFDNKYHYDYDPSGSYLTEGYPLLEGSGDCNPEQQTFDTPSVSYDGAVGPLDHTAQNGDLYVTYV